MSKVFFITGAGRGMGVDFAREALSAGHRVVATGRSTEAVTKTLGEHKGLLALRLDINSRDEAEAAVLGAVARFGQIDVLVNNAGSFYAGFFEETSDEQFRSQIETNLFGTLNVTRAILPIMRRQGSGLVVTISSSAGLAGGEFTSAYCVSKFAIEGWMESLAPEVAPFGIRTTIIEPGMFRTELLEPASTTYAELSLPDYAKKTAEIVPAWQAASGTQAGDPAKLARAVIKLADSNEPPQRLLAGNDALASAEKKIQTLVAQIEANRTLSTSLNYDA